MYPPREGDLPLQEVYDSAVAIVATDSNATVFFKFTCSHCGERCTFEEANSLYSIGECHGCGKNTELTHAGFSVVYDLVQKEQQ